MLTFIAWFDPDVTVWYHQPWNRVDCNTVKVGQSCAAYAAAVGLPVTFDDRPGTATDWINSNGYGVSFVVEFGLGNPSNAKVAAHAAAILALAR